MNRATHEPTCPKCGSNEVSTTLRGKLYKTKPDPFGLEGNDYKCQSCGSYGAAINLVIKEKQ